MNVERIKRVYEPLQYTDETRRLVGLLFQKKINNPGLVAEKYLKISRAMGCAFDNRTQYRLGVGALEPKLSPSMKSEILCENDNGSVLGQRSSNWTNVYSVSLGGYEGVSYVFNAKVASFYQRSTAGHISSRGTTERNFSVSTSSLFLREFSFVNDLLRKPITVNCATKNFFEELNR